MAVTFCVIFLLNEIRVTRYDFSLYRKHDNFPQSTSWEIIYRRGKWQTEDERKGKRSKTKKKTKFSNTFFASIRSAMKDENLCNQSRKFDGSSFFIHENLSFLSMAGHSPSVVKSQPLECRENGWCRCRNDASNMWQFFIPFMKLLLLAIDQSAHQFDYPRQSVQIWYWAAQFSLSIFYWSMCEVSSALSLVRR